MQSNYSLYPVNTTFDFQRTSSGMASSASVPRETVTPPSQVHIFLGFEPIPPSGRNSGARNALSPLHGLWICRLVQQCLDYYCLHIYQRIPNEICSLQRSSRGRLRKFQFHTPFPMCFIAVINFITSFFHFLVAITKLILRPSGQKQRSRNAEIFPLAGPIGTSKEVELNVVFCYFES